MRWIDKIMRFRLNSLPITLDFRHIDHYIGEELVSVYGFSHIRGFCVVYLAVMVQCLSHSYKTYST